MRPHHRILRQIAEQGLDPKVAHVIGPDGCLVPKDEPVAASPPPDSPPPPPVVISVSLPDLPVLATAEEAASPAEEPKVEEPTIAESASEPVPAPEEPSPKKKGFPPKKKKEPTAVE